jgi:hypothetical protein
VRYYLGFGMNTILLTDPDEQGAQVFTETRGLQSYSRPMRKAISQLLREARTEHRTGDLRVYLDFALRQIPRLGDRELNAWLCTPLLKYGMKPTEVVARGDRVMLEDLASFLGPHETSIEGVTGRGDVG